MSELLRNAWNGWLRTSDAGKLGAVLFLVLLLLWGFRLTKGRQREALIYGMVMTVICTLPFTAILLMLWQTKFYDYEWIWTAVPLTGLIALGGVLLLNWIWDGAWTRAQKILVTGMILGMLLLCGRLGNSEWAVRDLTKERKEIAEVLEEIHKTGSGELCLWAPKEVVEQVRSLDPGIVLLYGRNMWQGRMNAYLYDGYDQDRRDLYVWMIMIGRYGTLDVPVATDLDVIGERLEAGGHLEGLACIQKAVDLGVDRILLPGNMTEEALETLRRETSAEIKKVGNYWLVWFPEGLVPMAGL